MLTLTGCRIVEPREIALDVAVRRVLRSASVADVAFVNCAAVRAEFARIVAETAEPTSWAY